MDAKKARALLPHCTLLVEGGPHRVYTMPHREGVLIETNGVWRTASEAEWHKLAPVVERQGETKNHAESHDRHEEITALFPRLLENPQAIATQSRPWVAGLSREDSIEDQARVLDLYVAGRGAALTPEEFIGVLSLAGEAVRGQHPQWQWDGLVLAADQPPEPVLVDGSYVLRLCLPLFEAMHRDRPGRSLVNAVRYILGHQRTTARRYGMPLEDEPRLLSNDA